MTSRRTAAFVVVAALSACLLPAQSALKITSPKEALGFNLGDDYQVANYTQLETYWKKLASESPRMKLESIGKTEEGREQWMAIITSPENMKKLARYKEIAGKLAHAEGVSEQEARGGLAELLPNVVDHFTPDGRLPPMDQLVASIDDYQRRLDQ